MNEKDKEEQNLKYFDNITGNEKEIALAALSEFKMKNFNACLQSLHKLEHRTFDFKVPHNIAVAEFYKRNLTKTKLFEKNLQNISEQFNISAEKLADVNYCSILYNLILLLFNSKQYTLAIKSIERIYKFIEPMDTELAKLVCVLATELYLSVKLPDKALAFIKYAETNLLSEKKSQDLKSNEQEEFKCKILKYKLQCQILKHELSAASLELEKILNLSKGFDVQFMKANLEYLKGNYEEAVKSLTAIPKNALVYENCGNCSNVLFYNNMAVIHYAMGKHNIAAHYCKEALKQDITTQNRIVKNEDEHAMGILGGSKYHELMYNLGVTLLYSGKPAQAFECLIITVRRYHRNPRIWLRIAECCINVHKNSNDADYDMAKKQKEMLIEIVGTRQRQKYVLNTKLTKDKKFGVESQSYAVPVPTLEFASICLRNALISLPSDDADIEPVPMFTAGANPSTPNPSSGPCPSAPLTPDGAVKLKNGVLIASAYVALCLGDYIMSLEYSQLLLAQPKTSSVHRTLAHLYAAESLVLLDRIGEAIEHLNPEHVKDLNFDLEPQEDTIPECEQIKAKPPTKWFPQNIQTMVATIQYNLAVVKTIRGQYDHAATLLKQIWQQRNTDSKIPVNVLMLVIYIELQLGHLEIAKNLIKQYGLNLKGSAQQG